MKANKFFLSVIAVSFDSNSQGTNFDISLTQCFYSKKVVGLWSCGIYHLSLAASTDKTYFHADRPDFPDRRVKGSMRTSEEIGFGFRLKLKIT